MKKDTILHTMTKLLVRNWRTPVRSAAYSSALTSAQNNTRNLSNILFPHREQNIPTLGMKYSQAGNKMGLRLASDEITARASRDYGSCPTRLRLVVLMFLTMVLGVSYVWGQPGAGFYRIYTHNGDAFQTGHPIDRNWYLWPSTTTTDKKNITDENATGNQYVTTYDAISVTEGMTNGTTHFDAYDETYSIWRVIPVTDGSNTYYQFFNVGWRKYMIWSTKGTGDDALMQLVSSIPSDATKTHFEVTDAGRIRPRGTTTDISLSPKGSHGAFLSAQNQDKGGANYTADNSRIQGLIKLWDNKSDNPRLWTFESVSYTPAPVITPNSERTKFTISCSMPPVPDNYKIYYAFDDDDPDHDNNPNSIEYTTGEIELGNHTKVKAIAVIGSTKSEVAMFSTEKCVTPTITLNKADGTVTITSPSTDDGAKIYYTTSTANPTLSSTEYSGIFTLPLEATAIKAIAANDASNASDVATYDGITKLAPPVLSKSGATITITKPTTEENGTTALEGPDAVSVYYNLSNTDPTANSTPSTGSIALSETLNSTTIKAIAYKAGYIKSDVTSISVDKCAQPTIVNNLDGTITLACTTNGAKIFYRIGASNVGSPNNTSTSTNIQYIPEAGTNYVTLSELTEDNSANTTITVRAFLAGYCQSDVLTYTVPTCPVPFMQDDNNGKIKMSCSVSDAKIYYRTSSTGSWTLYNDSERPSAGDYLGAYAAHAGYLKSNEVTYSAPITVTSATEVLDMNGNYILGSSFSGTIGTSDNPFRGTIDGKLQTISISQPLVAYADGATIKNVIVNISSLSGESEAGNKGAIVCEATGNTRIYNCGVLSGSISGTNYVGGIAGKLDEKARVINCYSFADITGGNVVGGIVGYNSGTTTRTSINTMVMNCMFYGNITGGTTVSPIYGGNIISNVDNTGLNNFNYFRQEATISGTPVYNCALAMEERYLNRIEFFRNMENSNRELAAIYATGNAENAYDKMAKWVLDKRIADYPILKEQGYYSSVINYDPSAAPETPEEQKTIEIVISGITTLSGVKVTDKDPNHFNYNYNKVQLPYYNDYRKDNYQGNRVVTGWDIVSVTGSNEVTYEAFEDNNYANFLSKDKYSGRVFSQGAYFDVPKGVTSITISPHWADCVYLSDAGYDATGYSANQVTQLSRYSNNSQYVINGSSQVVYTTWANAIANLPSGGTSVYDRAIVLVGNYHNSSAPPTGTMPFTIMSADLNFDNEPDYSLIYHHNKRSPITPIRFDFLNIPNTSMVQKTKGTGDIKIMAVLNPEGWFEITNTCMVRFSQFEYDSGSKTANGAPVILLGGYYEQFIASHTGTSQYTTYLHLGGNAWVREFSAGTHIRNANITKHCPISITGGQYDKFYLSGLARPDVNSGANNHARCYINGGKFTELAGAGQEQIDGNVTWQICNADITNFYGGGINAGKPITGDISITLYGGNIDTFCGGPKFGNMASGKTVTTTATGTKFGTYFGAGNGGTSFYRQQRADVTCNSKYPNNTSTSPYNPTQSDWNGWTGEYVKGKYEEGKGIAANFEYEFIDGS